MAGHKPNRAAKKNRQRYKAENRHEKNKRRKAEKEELKALKKAEKLKRRKAREALIASWVPWLGFV